MRLPHLKTATPLLAAIALTGCGRSGYGTVNTHQLVLIPTALPALAAARHADAALVCAARMEARRLHHALTVERPRTGSASAQIAVAGAVTADKPGGVLIIPVASNPMLAPVLSMRRAGIEVVRLAHPRDARMAAVQGARAVARAVRAIEGRAHARKTAEPVSLGGRCAPAH